MLLLSAGGIAIGKASNYMILAILGATSGVVQGYVTHTLFTNLRFEPDEFNFFKSRRESGTRSAFHARDERYE